MDYTKIFKDHPLMVLLGFACLSITLYELTVGEVRRSQVDLLSKEVTVLNRASDTMKTRLNNAIEKDELEDIARQAALTVVGIYSNDNRNVDEYELKTDTRKVGNTVSSDFYLEHKIEFKPGGYLLSQAYESSKLLDAISTYIILMNQIYENGGLTKSYNLEAQFEGSADRHSSKEHVGMYEGEFGVLKTPNVLINGRQVDIFLMPGDELSNDRLAFLRSYSVFDSFKKQATHLPGQIFNGDIRFIANESKKVGQKYRYGKVIVNISG